VIHQLEVGHSTLNGFQESTSSNDFGLYLLGILKNSNTFISILIKNLTLTSPMHRIFSSLNVIFILVILTLIIFGIQTWVYPKYPNRVDGENQIIISREIAPLKIKRQTFTPQSVNEIVSQNLFRKERSEYQPPTSPKSTSQVAKITPKSSLPAPKLILKGVMLLSGTKIAILEGSHPVTKEGKVESIPIKRKGYYLGDRISGYKLSKISKREVILDNSEGQIIAVKLKSDMSTDEISKFKQNSTDLKDELSKSKQPKPKQPKPNTASTEPVVKQKPQPTPRISGSRLTPLPKHISGM
jgi:hypothetical protein